MFFYATQVAHDWLLHTQACMHTGDNVGAGLCMYANDQQMVHRVQNAMSNLRGRVGDEPPLPPPDM